MFLHFILSSLCFIAATQGYPAAKPTQKECCINQLPLEILSQIFENADSLPTLSNCAQSCKYWNQVLSSKSYNTLQHAFRQQPAKKKHLLQSLVEPSPSGNRLEEYVALKNLDAIQSDGELCSVEQHLLVQAAAKYGEIQVLHHYYDNVLHHTANQTNQTLADSLHHLLLLAREPSKGIFFDFLLDRLNEIDQQERNVDLHSLKMSLTNGFIAQGIAPTLRQDVEEWDVLWQLLLAAAKSGNHTLYSEYFNLLQSRGLPENTNLLIPVAMCKSCDENDFVAALDTMRSQGVEEEKLINEVIPSAMIWGCTNGFPHLLNEFLMELPEPNTPIFKCIEAAFVSGNMENIKFLEANFPDHQQEFLRMMERIPSTVLASITTWSPDSIRYLARRYSVEYVASLFDSSDGAQEVLRYYSAHSCGNDQDMAVIRYLTTQTNASVTDDIFSQFISRPQFMGLPKRRSRYCPRNESTQALEFILQDLKFVPSPGHLNAALKTGRYDIAKMVYEMGRKNGAALVIDRESLRELMPTVVSFDHRLVMMRSNQDLELLDYVFEKAFGKGWNRDSLSEEDMRVIREFPGTRSVGIFENTQNFMLDCYYAYLKQLKLLE